MTKWYTGSGDSGKTKLPSIGEVWKDDDILEALGDLDELNSILGVISSLDPKISELIKEIQNDIFIISSEVAGFKMNFSEDRVRFIEEKINELSKELEPLKNFVIPSGSLVSTFTHFARAVCRRAERKMVKLLRENKAEKMHVIYLNRLSSLLFVLALWLNKTYGSPNILWNPNKKNSIF
jgi:cob(I)alamin adenosyltransferase